jgi:ABC-type phosphate transport system substrate-binding protein
LQKTIQQSVWAPGYISAGCGAGSNAEPEYVPTSNLEGPEKWDFVGKNPFARAWSFIATDEAPSTEQIGSAKTAAGAGSNVVVVPVAQTAIAVIVHAPEGCTLEKITNVNLEEAFKGKAETWAAIGGVGGPPCEGKLTRVVREDAAGITAQFKAYLAVVNQLRNGGVEAATCAGEPKWSELEAGAANTQWPKCGAIAPKAVTGGAALATEVATTAGTIGYVALPDAKSRSATTARVQNNGISGSPIYVAPTKGTEEANCAKAEYTTPAAARTSGSGLNVDWSKVLGVQPSSGGEIYPLCMLTYDLAWNNYVTAGFAAGIGSYVKSYLNYIVTNGTGAGSVKKWLANLPTSALEEHDVKMAAEYAVSLVN